MALAPLTRLTELDFKSNELAAGGWQHLAGMQQLASLCLEECDLTAVPQVLSQLTALTSLNMSGNPIVSGWQYLAGMQQLASLTLNDCSLAAVPEVLSQLTALTHLLMYSNPIASGWQHLSQLPLCELWTDDFDRAL